jgi:predicted enzyme related to lactoylglutathione lyase
MKFEICIDVDDVNSAVEFYSRGLGLTVAKHESDWAEIKIGEQTIWIMKVEAGTQGRITRTFHRHWTPVHLDLIVEEDIEDVVKRAVTAGGRLEHEIQRSEKGALANISDPAGNGIDIVQR